MEGAVWQEHTEGEDSLVLPCWVPHGVLPLVRASWQAFRGGLGGDLVSMQEAWDALLCVILHIQSERRSPRHLYWQGEEVIQPASTRVTMVTWKHCFYIFALWLSNLSVWNGEESNITSKFHWHWTEEREKNRNLRVSDNSTSNVILVQDKFTLESTDL